MAKGKFRAALPYVVGLAVAALLFHYAQEIEYTHRPGALGPDFWPKAAIALMAIVCLIEIARALLGFRAEAHGVAEALEAGADGEEDAPKYPWLLAGGIVLVIVYAVVVDTLGFLLATFLFLGCFMYLGRYRKHLVVWATSGVITLLAALLFMRIAYVSLPRGEPPFDMVTDFIRIMMGG
jgi:putative tricarboxylic transport membrane protein